MEDKDAEYKSGRILRMKIYLMVCNKRRRRKLSFFSFVIQSANKLTKSTFRHGTAYRSGAVRDQRLLRPSLYQSLQLKQLRFFFFLFKLKLI